MNFFNAITSCLTGRANQPDNDSQTTNEKKCPPPPEYRDYVAPGQRTNDDIASDIVLALRRAEKPGLALKHTLDDIVGTTGWTENIAKAVLRGLEDIIKKGASMSQAMQDALERAVEEAVEFAEAHPVYFTILALGVLVALAPWVIEAVGFGELGPIEGSFAAAWQSRYAGYVPKGSLFSFFQRLGMTWK